MSIYAYVGPFVSSLLFVRVLFYPLPYQIGGIDRELVTLCLKIIF